MLKSSFHAYSYVDFEITQILNRRTKSINRERHLKKFFLKNWNNNLQQMVLTWRHQALKLKPIRVSLPTKEVRNVYVLTTCQLNSIVRLETSAIVFRRPCCYTTEIHQYGDTDSVNFRETLEKCHLYLSSVRSRCLNRVVFDLVFYCVTLKQSISLITFWTSRISSPFLVFL